MPVRVVRKHKRVLQTVLAMHVKNDCRPNASALPDMFDLLSKKTLNFSLHSLVIKYYQSNIYVPEIQFPVDCCLTGFIIAGMFTKRSKQNEYPTQDSKVGR